MMLALDVWALVQVLAASFPMQLHDNMPGKTAEDGPSWETREKLLAAGFGPAQPWLFRPFGE